MKLNRHLLLATTGALLWAMPVVAQTAPQTSGGLENIVVTARKREETLISTPVVISALSQKALQNYAITSMDDVSRVVPMLMIGSMGGSVQGGEVSIRGIAGPDSNPFGDQAVSFNVDGVALSMSTVRRMSDMDQAQVEVLKGPQALFYGKDSPAGVISIHSADPTNHLEAKAEVGYEAVGEEIRGEGYISGPINDAFSARLAGFYSHTDGWLKDATYGTNSPYAIDHPNDGRSSDFAVRGTMKYDPGSTFDAKLKVSFGQTKNDGPAAVTKTFCAGAARATGSGLPCGLSGDYAVNASNGTVVGKIPGTLNSFGNGQGFQNQKQLLGSLELNYSPSDVIKLTSVTGYYWVDLKQCQNYENDTAFILPSCNPTNYHQFSEEIRATTNYQGPVNFAAGGYFGHTAAGSGSITYLFGGNFDLLGPGFGGPNTPAQVNNYWLTQHGDAYSAYLQMIYKPIDVIEIDAGGRYSYEKKHVTAQDGGGLSEGTAGTAVLTSANNVAVINPTRSWSDFSPEITISYRPSRDLTFFGSYKHSFLSGGFNSSSVSFNLAPDIGYGPEIIKGFEIGMKSLLVDETLSLNLAAYTYKGTGMQVTNFQNATSTIHNAAEATFKGVEGDFNYKTMITGLSLHGAAAYNQAKYNSFPNAPCYNGQSPALGCNVTNGGVANSAQNLAGKVLPRSPKVNLSGGINFETPVGSDLKLALSGDVIHSSSFLTDDTDDIASKMPAYTMFDAAAHLSNEGDVWMVSLIGKNLTNKYVFFSAPNVPFTGTNGGVVPAVLGDRFATVGRGREVWIKVSYKFNGN